jgi:ABC-2 type transport system permease protein
MNPTVMQLTARTVLTRNRALATVLLPLVMIGAAVIIRLLVGVHMSIGNNLLSALALSTVVPLLGLIAGTGVIGPEIDDGSIVYLLTKPINRLTIVLSKYVVAIGMMTLFATVPILVTGLILVNGGDGLVLGYTVASLVAGLAYGAIFLALAVSSRNAIVLGLGYALLWESLIGSYVPGAQALSVQQWSRAVASPLVDSGSMSSSVSLTTGAIALMAVTVAALWSAGRRLRSLRPVSES